MANIILDGREIIVTSSINQKYRSPSNKNLILTADCPLITPVMSINFLVANALVFGVAAFVAISEFN